MASFFPNQHRMKYRTQVERLFGLLSFISTEPKTKWAIICYLQSNTPTVNRILDIAFDKDLISIKDRTYRITSRGKDLIGVWNS